MLLETLKPWFRETQKYLALVARNPKHLNALRQLPIEVKLAFNDVGKTVHRVMLCHYQTKSCPHGTHGQGEGPGKHPSAHEVGIKYEDRGCGHTIDWLPPQTGGSGR